MDSPIFVLTLNDMIGLAVTATCIVVLLGFWIWRGIKSLLTRWRG